MKKEILKIPKVKADDFVKYDEETANWTNFEELKKRVELLQENLDEIAQILIDNGIVRKKVIEAPQFDDDDLFRRLEE